LRFLVERRHAHKDVGFFRKNSFFGKRDQATAEALPPPIRSHRHALNVTGECAFHLQNDEAAHLSFGNGHINFSQPIGHNLERFAVSSLQGNPWLGSGHDLRAGARFGFAFELPNIKTREGLRFHFGL
jgi:hypothetical protein